MAKTNTMAKGSVEVSHVSVLQLLGGLLFLAVAWELWGVASAPANWTSGLTGSALFATVFYAVAVLSSLGVFFGSIKHGDMGGWKMKKKATMAGFSLALLTATNPVLFFATLVGFLACTVGSKHGAMCNCQECSCAECNCSR